LRPQNLCYWISPNTIKINLILTKNSTIFSASSISRLLFFNYFSRFYKSRNWFSISFFHS
jgi:hypothetical protein